MYNSHSCNTHQQPRAYGQMLCAGGYDQHRSGSRFTTTQKMQPALFFLVQGSILIIFPSGPPSAPGLTAIPGGDLASFDLTITPSTPPDCVVNYVITATSSDDSRDITVPASEVDGFIPVNVGGFDACTRAYSFTVAPVTSEGTGMRSASVVSGKW